MADIEFLETPPVENPKEQVVQFIANYFNQTNSSNPEQIFFVRSGGNDVQLYYTESRLEKGEILNLKFSKTGDRKLAQISVDRLLKTEEYPYGIFQPSSHILKEFDFTNLVEDRFKPQSTDLEEEANGHGIRSLYSFPKRKELASVEQINDESILVSASNLNSSPITFEYLGEQCQISGLNGGILMLKSESFSKQIFYKEILIEGLSHELSNGLVGKRLLLDMKPFLRQE